MPAKTREPHPIFAGPDSMGLSIEQYSAGYPCVIGYLKSFSPSIDVESDFKWGLSFLARHNRAPGTFSNYRTVVERLLQWSWILADKSALTLSRSEFSQFMSFCEKPPLSWVGAAPAARFVKNGDSWAFNEGWRPFDVRSRSVFYSHRPFKGTLRQVHRICSSFYSYLYAEDATAANPVVATRLLYGNAEEHGHPVRYALSPAQIPRVMQILESRAAGNPVGERALFIVAATVFMCLRALDLATVGEHCPSMDCFSFEEGRWWLVLDTPGAPPHRQLVTAEFLPYLRRYRKSRGLPEIPERGEGVPILETCSGRPGLTGRHIYTIVREALRQVHADICASGESGDQWNVLLEPSLSLLRDSGAMKCARTQKPAELQRDLRIASLGYTYDKYYR